MKHLLLLIRHGESTWNVEHRLPGQLPGIDLTEEGRAQAQRLASALRMLPLSSIISSPLSSTYAAWYPAFWAECRSSCQ